MKEAWDIFRLAFAAVGGWIVWFLGGAGTFLYALIAFVAVDYVAGVMCAIVEKTLSSEIGAKGIIKKIMIFILVGVAHTIDMLIMQNGGVLRTAVILFFLSNEGISLLENSARIGLPVPERLREALTQLHNQKDLPENSNKETTTKGGENDGNK